MSTILQISPLGRIKKILYQAIFLLCLGQMYELSLGWRVLAYKYLLFVLVRRNAMHTSSKLVLCDTNTWKGRNPVAWPSKVESFPMGLITAGEKKQMWNQF